ncbi:MAG: cytochrome b [Gammaproteobacteria bacterium]
MRFINTDERYGLVSFLLHWIVAIIIIGLIIVGLYMTRIPISSLKLKLYGWHKQFGLLILALLFLRIAWRLSNVTPRLPATLPAWQKLAARSVHFVFYLFMFFMPITGWLVTSAAGLPVSFFGWFVLPSLVEPDESNRLLYAEIHQWLAYGLILTLGAHIGAALKHHFINKDNILRRMLWPD